MKFPNRSQLEYLLLQSLFRAGGRSGTSKAYAMVKEQLLGEYSANDLEVRDSDGRSKLEHEIRWAKDSLRTKGWLKAESRGEWVLTSEGEDAASGRVIEKKFPEGVVASKFKSEVSSKAETREGMRVIVGPSVKADIPSDGLEIFIDAGEADEEDIAEALIALSDMQRAAGGLGLEFRHQSTHAFKIAGEPTC